MFSNFTADFSLLRFRRMLACAQRLAFVQFTSKGCLGSKTGMSNPPALLTFAALPKRFKRHRNTPPEFHKKYVPIVTDKEIDGYRNKTGLDPNAKLPVSPVKEAPQNLRQVYLLNSLRFYFTSTTINQLHLGSSTRSCFLIISTRVTVIGFVSA